MEVKVVSKLSPPIFILGVVICPSPYSQGRGEDRISLSLFAILPCNARSKKFISSFSPMLPGGLHIQDCFATHTEHMLASGEER